MTDIARILIISGIVLTIAGVVLYLFSNTTGIPRLPGDLYFKRGNFTFYFPIVSSILISIILTVIINFFFRR